MTIYRLHLEGKNKEGIEKAIKQMLGEDYEIIKESDNFWKVQKKNTTIIEIHANQSKT